MSKYFIPHLDPSQANTAGEYLVAHGQQISSAMQESVIEADRLLDYGERISFALTASFAVEGKTYCGIVMVTTHNFYCCSSVSHNLITIRMPYTECIGIGNVKGLLTKKLPIHCETIAVEISSTSEKIAQLTDALLHAISAAPQYSPLTFPGGSGITRRSATQHKATEEIKKAHLGERRLSKAEAAAYGKCPECNGTILTEKAGRVFCFKCGHLFTPSQK